MERKGDDGGPGGQSLRERSSTGRRHARGDGDAGEPVMARQRRGGERAEEWYCCGVGSVLWLEEEGLNAPKTKTSRRISSKPSPDRGGSRRAFSL